MYLHTSQSLTITIRSQTEESTANQTVFDINLYMSHQSAKINVVIKKAELRDDGDIFSLWMVLLLSSLFSLLGIQ